MSCSIRDPSPRDFSIMTLSSSNSIFQTGELQKSSADKSGDCILLEKYSGRQKSVKKFENNVLVNLIQPLCALGFPLSCAICSQKEVLKKLHVSTHLKRDKNLFNCLLQQDAGLLNTVNLLKKQKV